MSLPPLPEVFGNYVLGKDFSEVVSPPAVDWLPQTPGWYLAGAALLALSGRWTWHRLRHWYRNRYRREAAARLQALAGSDKPLTEINRLLKLTAMAAFSREQVARLSGEQWLVFLNAQCDPAPFSDRDIRLLTQDVYRGGRVDAAAGSQLLRASLTWVRQHKNRYDD